MNAFAALVRKDVVLYLSNRRALLVTLAAPILIAAFFGYVFGGPPRKMTGIPVAVVDLDQSALSKSIIADMKSDTSFDLREMAEPEAVRRVREGQVRAAAVIPPGFGRDAPRALFRPDVKKPEIVVHYDPSQATALPLVRGLLAQHVMTSVGREVFNFRNGMKTITDLRSQVEASTELDAERKRDLLGIFDSVERLQSHIGNGGSTQDAAAGPGFSLPFETRQAEVTGRVDRRYNGYAHSFAGMGVQFILFMGIEMGVGLLLMRRMDLWKRLRAAPVSRGLLLGSRIASGTLIALMLLTGIYAAAIAVFGVRIDGSFAGFFAVAIAFALLTSTFGLLIAALGRTPEATRGLAILATLLLVMLGGAWVPTFVFPEWLQQITVYMPTRWAIDGLEAVTWRGQGLEVVWMPVLAMIACSALFAAIAVRRFAWDE
jgi:ABC-2 type transport system permease protein